MTGHSVFTHNPETLNKTETRPTITEEQYADWQRQFTADALLGLRYGQSFCNTFGINDHLLFYTREVYWCQRYIEDRYLARRKV